MKFHRLFMALAVACGAWLMLGLSSLAGIHPISTNTIHLGGATPEWSIFEGRKPQGSELRLKFKFARNSREHTLFIRQDDVKQDWIVNLNGKKLGSLFLMEAELVHTLAIPADSLRDGENELHIAAKTLEDILIHSITIADDSRTNVLTAGPLKLRVENLLAVGLPARITVLDTNGSLAAIQPNGMTNLTARPGVVYTPNGEANLFLLPGKYTIHATRGPEYSIAKTEVTLDQAQVSARLTITNEINTGGWISSDTHIHTLSLSKHGDALLHERMITLAGENIELPVATEHNLHADYAPAAAETGLDRYFTIIPGNEVTTKRGHFNIFPVSLDAKPVDHTVEHWPDLLRNIRQSPGVKLAILNHPTDTHSGFTPFAATNLNRVTGKNLRGDFNFEFDAMELVNSGAMRTDWMEPFTAWFALLNRGYRIVGVGASDSHDVSRFIVGQGRTYIQGEDADPAKIDIPKACENLRQGRAVVSLGLFTRFGISDAPDALDAPSLASGLIPPSVTGIGELHSGPSDFFEVSASIDFPTWVNPAGQTIATVFANGRPLIVFPFDLAKKPGTPHAFKARFAKPKTDTWYALVAHAPGVTNAWWPVARPYQPASPEWNPVMIGAANPIYLDADRDGRFTAPRATAAQLHKQHPSAENLVRALDAFDWAVAVHAAEILRETGADIQSDAFKGFLATALPVVQQAFADYLVTISKP